MGESLLERHVIAPERCHAKAGGRQLLSCRGFDGVAETPQQLKDFRGLHA